MLASPAAKKILLKLQPIMEGFGKERRIARIGTALKKSLHETGELDLGNLYGFEMHESYPLDSLLKVPVKISVEKGMVQAKILPETDCITLYNNLVTGFFIELILLHGNLSKDGGLRVEAETSEVFNLPMIPRLEIKLVLLLPEKNQWVLLLKVSCMEGKTLAVHQKQHVMRVRAIWKGGKQGKILSK